MLAVVSVAAVVMYPSYSRIQANFIDLNSTRGGCANISDNKTLRANLRCGFARISSQENRPRSSRKYQGGRTAPPPRRQPPHLMIGRNTQGQRRDYRRDGPFPPTRSEEHTSELQ